MRFSYHFLKWFPLKGFLYYIYIIFLFYLKILFYHTKRVKIKFERFKKFSDSLILMAINV